MDKLKILTDRINSLFSKETVTKIHARDLLIVPMEEWQYLNGGRIRYKIIEKSQDHCVSITEWLENDTFHNHFHDDADEIIFIMKGALYNPLDKIRRTTFSKLWFKANTIHAVKGIKGTLIAVRFDFIEVDEKNR